MSAKAGMNQHNYATRSKGSPSVNAAQPSSNECSPTDATPTKAINAIPKKSFPKRNDDSGVKAGTWRRKIYT